MNITFPIAITYGLLAASIVAVWLQPLRINDRTALPPWVAIFATACAAGLSFGLVAWQGVVALAGFACLALIAKRQGPGLIKVALLVATGWMTLALSVHKFPGFANPSLVANMRVSQAAPAFTHNLNFDTTAAGLILFAIFCTQARSLQEWRKVARQYRVIFGTAVMVFAIGMVVGYVSFDFKVLAYTPVFFLCNLLFTCVTEEAFFRGFIQHQLSTGLQRWRGGPYIAMIAAALLFGIAHAKGGPLLIGLASLAGIGYGYAFLRSQRIEAAILTHFVLNALHFLAFTYPRTI